MTTLTREELLVLVMEEAAEVIQAASKCIRFGWDHHEPGYGVNSLVLAKELGDLEGITKGLPLSMDIWSRASERKLAKAEGVKAARRGPKMTPMQQMSHPVQHHGVPVFIPRAPVVDAETFRLPTQEELDARRREVGIIEPPPRGPQPGPGYVWSEYLQAWVGGPDAEAIVAASEKIKQGDELKQSGDLIDGDAARGTRGGDPPT